ADLAADLVDLLEIVGEFGAVDNDAALLMFLEAVDAADHGRFPGPGGSANDDTLAALDLEIDVAQHVEVPLPLVHPNDVDGDFAGRSLHLRPGGPHFWWLGRLRGLGHHPLRSEGQRRVPLASRASV